MRGASAGSVNNQRGGLLRGMGMSSFCVHLELLDHGVAERAFGQHAFDGFFKRAARVFGLHVTKVSRRDAARVTRVAIVNFVDRLGAGHTQLGCIDDDDEVTGIDVRRINGLVLAAQTARHFGGYMTKNEVVGVNHEPAVLDVLRFGGKGFHGNDPGQSCFGMWLLCGSVFLHRQDGLDGGQADAPRKMQRVFSGKPVIIWDFLLRRQECSAIE